MIQPHLRVLAAVSGGPDSVCLLQLLQELAGPLGFTVSGVCHLNHRLRGAESDADEAFVRALAARGAIAFFSATADMTQTRGNLEQAARRARLRFFHSLIAEGHGDVVALGHTRDDQAETVLFRILRGAGTAGLAGILPVRADHLIRPLLDVTRAEVEAYLRERGIAWREDSSNLSPRFARNRIRRDLLPALEREWNPRLRTHLAHLADVAYEEERWWSAEVARTLAQVVEMHGAAAVIRKGAFTGLGTGLVRRVLREVIRAVKGDVRGIEFDHIEALRAFLEEREGGARLQLPGVEGTRSIGSVRLAAVGEVIVHAEPQPVEGPGTYRSPDGKSMIHLALSTPAPGENGCATLGMELCWAKIPKGCALRGWRAGDRYRPAGSSREHKLKELFQRAGVPSWRRPGWPILCLGEKILWSRGFGVAAEAAPAAGDTSQRLRIWETEVVPG